MSVRFRLPRPTIYAVHLQPTFKIPQISRLTNWEALNEAREATENGADVVGECLLRCPCYSATHVAAYHFRLD